MSHASTRIRTNGAYIIKSAESVPRPVQARGPLNGRAAIVTPEDKKLAEAVWLRGRS